MKFNLIKISSERIISDMILFIHYPELESRIVKIKEKDFDVIEAAQKNFHIVCVAIIGLTHFSSICQYSYGIDQEEQYDYTSKINSRKETGTLYPKHFLTIPYRYETSPFMNTGITDFTSGKEFLQNEIENHIRDSLYSEINYIKSNKIVFEFRDLGNEMMRYNSIVIKLLVEEFSAYEGEVFMYVN